MQLVGAVAIRVAQQGQAIAAFYRGVALGLEVAGDDVLGLELGCITAAALRHEDVAVGQHQGLAGDLQIGGNCRHAETVRHGGYLIAPGGRLGDLHAGQQAAFRLGQLGVRPVVLGGVLLATACAQQYGQGQGGQCA